MRKAKFYSTNVTGQHIVIKAFSLKQLAEFLGESVHKLSPYVSVCGPAVQQADVDLTVALVCNGKGNV